MAIELNQNVSTVVKIGPLVDVVSALPVSTFTLTAADSKTWHAFSNGTSLNLSAYTISQTTSGFYYLHLSAGTLSITGDANLELTDNSLILPYKQDFIIITSQYWNLKYGTSAMPAKVVSFAANALSADGLDADAITSAKIAAGALVFGDQLSAFDTATSTIVASALQLYHLDHLLHTAVPSNSVANSSIFAHLMATDGTYSNFSDTTDALQAIRDRGDAAWVGSVDLNSFVSAIWSAALADYTVAGTAGANLLSAMNLTSTAVGSIGTLSTAIGTRIDTLSGVVALSANMGTRFDTLSAAVSVIDANVDAVLDDTGTTGVAVADAGISANTFATGAIDAAALAADAATEIANAVWATTIESAGSITAQQATQIVLAITAGATRSGTSGFQFYTPNSGTLRVSFGSITSDKERSAITVNV